MKQIMKGSYAAPKIEIATVQVEQGIAASNSCNENSLSNYDSKDYSSNAWE